MLENLCQYSTKTATQIREFDHANGDFTSKPSLELNLNNKLCLSSPEVLD